MAALGEIAALFSMSAREYIDGPHILLSLKHQTSYLLAGDALDLDSEKCRWKRFTTADFVSICSRLGTQQIQKLRDERIKNTGAIKTQIPPGADVNPDLLLVFESYCSYKTLSQEPGEPGMSQQQLYKLCVDIGLTAPEGGPVTVPEMDVAFTRVKGPPHIRRITYPQWLILLCILTDKSGWDLFTILIYHAEKLDQNGMLPQPPPQQLRTGAASTAHSVSTASSMRTPGSIMFSEVDFAKKGEQNYASNQSSSAELIRTVQPSGKGEYLSIEQKPMTPINEDAEDRPSPSLMRTSRTHSITGRSGSFSPSHAAEPSLSEDLPSWLPGLLLRLTKLEQKAEARERSDLARGNLPSSREGGERVNQLLNQKRVSAPGGSDTSLAEVSYNTWMHRGGPKLLLILNSGWTEQEKKNHAIQEALLLKRAKEACRQVATDIVNQGIHEMELILQKADAAAEQAHQASIQAALSSEQDGPSIDSQVKEIGSQLKSAMTRIAVLDDKLKTTIEKGKLLESSASTDALSQKADKTSAAAAKTANEAALKSSSATKDAEKAASKAEEAQRAAYTASEMVKAVALDLANLSQVVGLQKQQTASNASQLMAIQSHLKSVVTLTEVMQSKQDQISMDLNGIKLEARSQPLGSRVSESSAPDNSNHAQRLQRLEADLQQLASFSGEVAGRFTALERDMVSTLKTYARSSDLKETEKNLTSKQNQLMDAFSSLKRDVQLSNQGSPSGGSSVQLQQQKFQVMNPVRVSNEGGHQVPRMQIYMVPTVAQQVQMGREMLRQGNS